MCFLVVLNGITNSPDWLYYLWSCLTFLHPSAAFYLLARSRCGLRGVVTFEAAVRLTWNFTTRCIVGTCLGGALYSLHCCFGSRNPFSITHPCFALVPPPPVPNLDSALASPSSFPVSPVLGKRHLTLAIIKRSELRNQITIPGVKPAVSLNSMKESTRKLQARKWSILSEIGVYTDTKDPKSH